MAILLPQAPAATSRWAISLNPLSHASSSGDLPYLSVICGLAPWSSSSLTISCCVAPPSFKTIASSSGVQPTKLVWLTLILVSVSNIFTISRWPFSQAGSGLRHRNALIVRGRDLPAKLSAVRRRYSGSQLKRVKTGLILLINIRASGNKNRDTSIMFIQAGEGNGGSP